MDKKVTVIGVGNLLCGDDGLGVRAVAQLRNTNLSPQVNLIAGETDAWFCLEHALAADYLIVIDAVYGGGPPGHIYTCDLEDLSDSGLDYTQHDTGLLSLVMLYNTAGYKIHGRLYGIEPESLLPGVGLSPCVATAIDRLAAEVNCLIKNFYVQHTLAK